MFDLGGGCSGEDAAGLEGCAIRGFCPYGVQTLSSSDDGRTSMAAPRWRRREALKRTQRFRRCRARDDSARRTTRAPLPPTDPPHRLLHPAGALSNDLLHREVRPPLDEPGDAEELEGSSLLPHDRQAVQVPDQRPHE